MAYRKEKLEAQIRRIVGDLLIREIKDPRIGFATITAATLAKDYSVVRIGISVLGTPRDMRKTFEGINSASGFIQHKLGKAIRLRTIPRVEFFLDSSVVDGVNMVGLIHDAVEGDRDSHAGDQEPADDGEPGDVKAHD